MAPSVMILTLCASCSLFLSCNISRCHRNKQFAYSFFFQRFLSSPLFLFLLVQRHFVYHLCFLLRVVLRFFGTLEPVTLSLCALLILFMEMREKDPEVGDDKGGASRVSLSTLLY